MMRALAQALVRRYPAAWRERYEREVSALIDDTSVRGRDLAELLQGLLTERTRELVAADDRPGRTMAVIFFLKIAFALAFVGTAIGVGLGLRQLTGPWSETAQNFGGAIVLVWFVLFVIIAIRARRRPLFSALPPYNPGAGAALLVSMFVSVAVVVAGQLLASNYEGRGTMAWISTYSPWFHLFVWTNMATDLCGSVWPSRQLLQAFGALQVAEAQLTSSQAWVAGCHEMIAQGVPSPLREAEAQADLRTRERDAARDRVHALGYRARFRQVDIPST